MSSQRAGFVVAAAFIGPGTVTTASMAGANYGLHLVWALLFSIVATMVLQDMAVRLGIATKQGLAEAIYRIVPNQALRWVIIGLVVAAIGIGNAAYESGNLTGAAIGLDAILPVGIEWWAVLIGLTAGALLWSGKHQRLANIMALLVAIMVVVFGLTFIVAKPDFGALFAQIFNPQLSSTNLTTVLALVGTTIVPYNLFLHASLVAKSAHSAQQLRRESQVAIGIGGLVTLLIMSTSMLAFFVHGIGLDAGNIGQQLEPVLGESGKYIFAIGLFAAGLSSAITAPLAAAYAVCGALGKPADATSTIFRAIWLTIIVIGVGFATFGIKPLLAILFAQATNALLLPIMAGLLLLVANQSGLMGELRNRWGSNLLGISVVLVVVGLSTYKLLSL